jgi:tRNA-2-methylthio-N6-dimethylallyladenosine synthase
MPISTPDERAFWWFARRPRRRLPPHRRDAPRTLYHEMRIIEDAAGTAEAADAANAAGTLARTYEIRTYGCQMNVHDSERLAGLLEEAGYRRAERGAGADVVVFNTCAVRENADNRLYGNLGHLRPVKNARPGMQIAVGGCLAQKDKGEIVRRAPWVDVVFGTHNIGSLPVLLERARVLDEAQVEIIDALERFPSVLPARRESAYSAWVAISVGCNNTCTFCIVPSLRGREEDRRPGDILAEIRALVGEGVVEVTLLGQNVNSYGVGFGDRQAFARLLRACGDVQGLERVRFTSPHPRDFTADVIAAMAETPNVMPQLHMPLQSGSDDVLKAMRRAYRRDKYLRIIEQVRDAMPDAAITTDIIVGFPGETERDFDDTLDVVRQARFAGAFTFQYSKRPGTAAAAMAGQVPPAVVQDRYDRLVALVEEIAWEGNRALTGRQVEVLVAEGEGRKDTATNRMSGRARDGRLVHFRPGEAGPRPGDMVAVTVTHAAPHHLIADLPPAAVRRTPGGDAWQAAAGAKPRGGDPLPQAPGPAPSEITQLNGSAACATSGGCGTGGPVSGPARPAVLLGMPAVGRPGG